MASLPRNKWPHNSEMGGQFAPNYAIDSLICQIHIYEILGMSDKALLSVKRIQEVLLKDYGIEEGPEVKVWNEKEKILMKSLEEK